MEAEITSTFSTADATGYYNSSDTITKLSFVENTSKWTNAELGRYLHIIIRPILLVFGTMGNFLTIYIMRRNFTEKSICLFSHVRFGSS